MRFALAATAGVVAFASVCVESLWVHAFAVEVSPEKTLVAPKRPGSAYMIWLSENRAKLSKTVGTNDVTKVAKAAGVEWNGLAESKKAKYVKESDKMKAIYVKELESFKAKGGVIERRSKKTKDSKVAKDPNRPKRAPSAYLLWLAANRADIVKKLPAGSKPTEVMKQAGVMWKQLKDASKDKYVKASVKAGEVYEKEMKKYQAGLGAASEGNSESRLTTTNKASAKKAAATKKADVEKISTPVLKKKAKATNK